MPRPNGRTFRRNTRKLFWKISFLHIRKARKLVPIVLIMIAPIMIALIPRTLRVVGRTSSILGRKPAAMTGPHTSRPGRMRT